MRFRLFPVILIVLGVTFLMGNLGIVPKDELRQFFHTWWPLLLVAIGSIMILRPRGHCHHRRCGSQRETLPEEAAKT